MLSFVSLVFLPLLVLTSPVSLVSQLTAQPDITKFSLPAVFLYPYTVLELGAFRALRYERMLAACKKAKNPVDRILEVTKWFLTSVERMEKMSKKPFNPVLGEELNVWVESADGSGATRLKAEQVSHHPPISAIIMRNDDAGVEFRSNVKFGITFNGNSVSCRLQGRAEVRLQDLKESYVAPNWVPDVVIQNVLFGTRRQLWLGEWSMSCKETDLGVKIVITEVNANAGWFSAVKAGIYENQLNGFVYKLSDPKETPIKTLSGLAGREIFVTDAKSGKKTLLIDCDALEVQELKFLAPEDRPANSSFNVWAKVVEALVVDDTGKADREKTAVETVQRDLRRQREASGEKFVPQYFFYNDETESFDPRDGLEWPKGMK